MGINQWVKPPPERVKLKVKLSSVLRKLKVKVEVKISSVGKSFWRETGETGSETDLAQSETEQVKLF